VLRNYGKAINQHLPARRSALPNEIAAWQLCSTVHRITAMIFGGMTQQPAGTATRDYYRSLALQQSPRVYRKTVDRNILDRNEAA
jgi:hypothetical protein